MELFARPLFLLYLLPVLAGVLVVIWTGKKYKAHLLHALFAAQTYQKMTSALRPETRMRTILLLLTVFFLFIALAGLQWGIKIMEAQSEFAQTIIAVDVSSSMKAQDVKPDRLDSAKTMLRMLINHLKEERIGLVAFTSKAYVQCPITTDEEALRSFIATLQPDMLPVPGTSLSEPVRLAAKMLAKYPGQKALILLTDGEDHSPEELSQAKETALKSGIRIIAIGIGTKEGTLIPDKVNSSGYILEYKKDKQGNTVVSKLDDGSLLELAKATGGAYIPYTTPAQVSAKVDTALRGLDKTRVTTAKRATYQTRYQFPLVLALLCLSGYLLYPRGARKKVK